MVGHEGSHMELRRSMSSQSVSSLKGTGPLAHYVAASPRGHRYCL